jgi:hypothetical protein
MIDRSWLATLTAMAIGCGDGASDPNAGVPGARVPSKSTSSDTSRSAEEGVMTVPVVFSGGHEYGRNDYGRPVVLMAAALGVTPEQFREAFSGVRPARGRGPTGEEQRKNKEALMRVLGPLGVTNERMDEVANYYRFRPQEGELWPTEEAEAYAEVKNGKLVRVVVTAAGSGYSSPPMVRVKGFAKAKLAARLKLSEELDENGGIAAVEIANEAD